MKVPLPGPVRRRVGEWRYGHNLLFRRRTPGWPINDGFIDVETCGVSFRVPASWRGDLAYQMATNHDSIKEFASLVRVAAAGDGVLFDVGAFHGLFTVAFCCARPDNRSVLFEPSPVPRADWEQLLSANGIGSRCEARPVAVGAAEGSCLATVQPPGFATLVTTAASNTYEVPMVTLDAEVERLGYAPTLLKIDVEGNELDVLRGAAGLIRQHRPHIFLELHLDALRRRGADPRAAGDLLDSWGYRVRSHAGRRVRPWMLSVSPKAVLRLEATPAT
ncbi:MAG TPA: FkbM family methyltransferase [Vicinamibacterales bacterium]|nr:FkbM family methyltransferase [Vicinamibacterales bacterium]